jgi:hypothetical protein
VHAGPKDYFLVVVALAAAAAAAVVVAAACCCCCCPLIIDDVVVSLCSEMDRSSVPCYKKTIKYSDRTAEILSPQVQ